MTRGSWRKLRVNTITTADVKNTIERAAALEGITVSAFVVAKAYRMALEATQRPALTARTLNRRDSRAFIDALLNPDTPNDTLMAAARRLKEKS